MIRFLSLPLFRRWEKYFNLDVALRYLRAGDMLGRRPAGKVLEVGSAGEGFGRYADVDLTAVEPRGSDGAVIGRTRVLRASGTALPFPDGSFDAVLSVDVLEHVPPEERTAFIKECLRVARGRVVLIFPSGKGAETQDEELVERARRFGADPDGMLEEHRRNGLPSAKEVAGMISSLAPDADVRVGKSLNLKVRRWIMRRWTASSRPGDLILYRLGVLLLFFRRRLDGGDCYRAVIDVRRSSKRPA
jgi:SAM-dependent methyltransferase